MYITLNFRCTLACILVGQVYCWVSSCVWSHGEAPDMAPASFQASLQHVQVFQLSVRGRTYCAMDLNCQDLCLIDCVIEYL